MEPNINSSGMMNGMPPAPMNNRKIGPIIGVLVVVLIIIVAVLYFFSNKLNTEPQIINNNVTTENNYSTTTDQTTTIEADLDAELKDVDYSF